MQVMSHIQAVESSLLDKIFDDVRNSIIWKQKIFKAFHSIPQFISKHDLLNSDKSNGNVLRCALFNGL